MTQADINARMLPPKPTAADVLAHVSYDPETGQFLRLVSLSNKAKEGAVAGCVNVKGYWRISICGRKYMGHQLAWLVTYGAWPSHAIDHVNGDRSDNRISNLRLTNHVENAQNMRRCPAGKGTPCSLGVFLWRGKYVARIRSGGRQHTLGRFASDAEAHAAYITAKRALHAGNTL